MRKLIIAGLIILMSASASQSQVLISLLFGDKLNTGKIEFGLQWWNQLLYDLVASSELKAKITGCWVFILIFF